jgi:hypothetical protein
MLWPAVLNGYPLVFDDTGTYLSQAVHHYLGWDRPPFYSLFLLPLHLTMSTWPVILVQSLWTSYVLYLVVVALLPGVSICWLVPGGAMLAVATALPWLTSRLMPDIFTPLLVLALSLLVFVPDRLSRSSQLSLVCLAAFSIAAQQSSLPLSIGLLAVLAPLRHYLGATVPLATSGVLQLVAAPMLACTALVSINIIAYGRPVLFPFGSVFVLARVIYDGPGKDILDRDCPVARWRLCAVKDRLPATSDEFLWRPDSPIMLAGGHKLIAAEAGSIIKAAVLAEPGRALHAWIDNGIAQLGRFATGDELHACPITVTPWIVRDFPAFERRAYGNARQTRGRLIVPGWLQRLHRIVAVGGIAGCCLVMLVGLRRRHVAAGFAAAVLLAVLGNDLIAGGFSTPHDRYGSRVMLLGPVMSFVGLVALRRRATSPS